MKRLEWERKEIVYNNFINLLNKINNKYIHLKNYGLTSITSASNLSNLLLNKVNND
jgi:hypothetical protein